jgi:hypothetical protein
MGTSVSPWLQGGDPHAGDAAAPEDDGDGVSLHPPDAQRTGGGASEDMDDLDKRDRADSRLAAKEAGSGSSGRKGGNPDLEEEEEEEREAGEGEEAMPDTEAGRVARSNDSDAERSMPYLLGGCSYRRADSVRDGALQTVV